jgi:alcohol dehydrogenase class IV
MSYVLAARHHLAHGVGCALALPYCIAYNQQLPVQIGTDLAEAVLVRSGASLRDVAEAVQSLTTAVGVDTDLEAHNTPEEEIPALAESIVRDYPRPTNPVPLEAGRLTTLLTYLRSGDLPGAWSAMEETA